MRRPVIHIVGAGLSGLSAAIRLAEAGRAEIVVHERLNRAGGKRRSFFDDASGAEVDSGHPFALASWGSTLAAIETIGVSDRWRAAEKLELAFADLASGERWKLQPNRGRAPWWIFSQKRRAPHTSAKDYLGLRQLARAPRSALVADYAPRRGLAAERVWRPFTLAVLNIEMSKASARLAGAFLRETLTAGAGGARLLHPHTDLSHAFIDPALRYLNKKGASVRFERELNGLDLNGDRVTGLEFENDRVDLSGADAAILAVPPDVARTLVPGLTAPMQATSTLTAHYAFAPASPAPKFLAVINGPFHWLALSADQLSVGVCDAGQRIEAPREKIASEFWAAAAALVGAADAMPAWRVIRRKRAAFAATPAQDALRPPVETPWRNLFLAGAYVQNGLPETMESAVRSGALAADKAVAQL